MAEKKTYVLDTTVLIDDPDIIYELGANEIVIPGAVIREIDGLKRNDRPAVAEAARKFARELDRLGSRGNIRKGVELVTTGTLRVVTSYDHVDELDSDGDNRVVGTALRLAREGNNVELLTSDTNMRTVARAHGVKATAYTADRGRLATLEHAQAVSRTIAEPKEKPEFRDLAEEQLYYDLIAAGENPRVVDGKIISEETWLDMIQDLTASIEIRHLSKADKERLNVHVTGDVPLGSPEAMPSDYMFYLDD